MPGLLIHYNVDAVHDALGQKGSPVSQGNGQGESLKNLQDFVWKEILATPCDVEEHCIEESFTPTTGKEYFKTIFHRLSEKTFLNIVEKLNNTFVEPGSTTSQWSVSVSPPAGLSHALPPYQPLGKLFKIIGGGKGKVTIERITVDAGIFKYHISPRNH